MAARMSAASTCSMFYLRQPARHIVWSKHHECSESQDARMPLRQRGTRPHVQLDPLERVSSFSRSVKPYEAGENHRSSLAHLLLRVQHQMLKK